jgi:hypothetical protein
MASTTSSIAPSALGASSTRSYAPATALLDRVEEDLGLDVRIDSEASSTIPPMLDIKRARCMKDTPQSSPGANDMLIV